MRRAYFVFTLWVLVSGIALAFYLWQIEHATTVQTEPVAQLNIPGVHRIWFTPSGDLAAYRTEGLTLRLWMFDPRRLSKNSTAVDAGRQIQLNGTLFSVSPEASRIASFGDQRIKLQSTSVISLQPTVEALLPDSYQPVLMGLGEFALATVDGAGEVRTFETGGLKPLGVMTTAVQGADTIRVTGRYVAIGNSLTGEAVSFDLGAKPQNAVAEARAFGQPFTVLAVSESGRLTIGTHSGRIQPLGLTALGPVRDLAFFHAGGYVATGDFPGVYVIGWNKTPQRASPMKGARLVAASVNHIVLAHQSGLDILGHHFKAEMNPEGRRLILMWLLLCAMILIPLVFRDCHQWVQEFLSQYRGDQPSRGGIRISGIGELSPPPPALLKDLSDGNCILFAGEELSRSSGIPLWRSFTLGLTGRAEDALLLSPETTARLSAMHEEGKTAAVSEELRELLGESRDFVLEFAQSMYLKPAPMNNVHDALAVLPFAGAVTPNLDVLLERVFRPGSGHLFDPPAAREVAPCLGASEFFLLKLRGLWSHPAAINLWPTQAAARNVETPGYVEAMSLILRTRVVIAVGMSLDELRLWLKGIPPTPQSKHVALVPDNDEGASQKAEVVARQYGFTVHTYPANDTRMLSDFLLTLMPAPAVTEASSERASLEPLH